MTYLTDANDLSWREQAPSEKLGQAGMIADNKQFPVHRKTAVVTGAARGLGLAFAQVLAGITANLNIILQDKILERIQVDYGVKIEYYKPDVTNREGVMEVIEKIQEDFGSVDIKWAATLLAQTIPDATTADSKSGAFPDCFGERPLIYIQCQRTSTLRSSIS